MDDIGQIRRVAHGAVRGTIAAMAMSGARTVTQSLGMIPESPPEAVLQRGTGGRLRSQTHPRTREVLIQAAHWGYGTFGGALFDAMPDRLRRRPWAGPIYGLALWLGFEVVIAPALEIRREAKMAERLALMADHLLYGLVLSEFRERPQR